MLTVNLVAVGKIKERYLTDACREYEKRLGAFCKINIIEVEEYRLPDNPSQALIDQGIEEEGRRIASKIPAGSCLVTLCIEGRQLTSPELARSISDWMLEGCSAVTFVIGGSNGLWAPLKERSRLRLSMSKMTFPHQLARVLLLEQVYRAMTINANHKYHK